MYFSTVIPWLSVCHLRIDNALDTTKGHLINLFQENIHLFEKYQMDQSSGFED